jgi:hypothetical protein
MVVGREVWGRERDKEEGFAIHHVDAATVGDVLNWVIVWMKK